MQGTILNILSGVPLPCITSVWGGSSAPSWPLHGAPLHYLPATLGRPVPGNFCMPKCDEPWYEAIFTGTTEGTAKVSVQPLSAACWRGAQSIETGRAPCR